MRNWTLIWAVLFGLCAGMAQAQTLLPCTGACPARYYFESQPCSSGSCARSYAPLPSEFSTAPFKGMSLSSPYEGAVIEVCAAYGQTLSGTGTLQVWTWVPWLPGDVSTSLPLSLDVADVYVTGTQCSYTTLSDGGVVSGVGAGDGGSNLKYACRCVHWTDWKMGGYSARRAMVSAVNVAVSGGSSLEVRIVGLETLR